MTRRAGLALSRGAVLAIVALAAFVASANASDKRDYDRRSVERYRALFAQLDHDRDGVVTRVEALGDLDFGPLFTDIDIDRDDRVTADELTRYLGLHYAAAGL